MKGSDKDEEAYLSGGNRRNSKRRRLLLYGAGSERRKRIYRVLRRRNAICVRNYPRDIYTRRRIFTEQKEKQ